MYSLSIYFSIYSHLHNTFMAGLPLLAVAMCYTPFLQMSIFSKCPCFIIWCSFFFLYLDLHSVPFDAGVLIVRHSQLLPAQFAMGPPMVWLHRNSLQTCRTNIIHLTMILPTNMANYPFCAIRNAPMSPYCFSSGSNGPEEMRLL